MLYVDTHSPPPIVNKERLIVTIDSVGVRGDGIAHVSGFVVFVSGGRKGMSYEIEISKILPTFAFGEILREAEVKNEREDEVLKESSEYQTRNSDGTGLLEEHKK